MISKHIQAVKKKTNIYLKPNCSRHLKKNSAYQIKNFTD